MPARLNTREKALRLLRRWLEEGESAELQKETYWLLSAARGVERYKRYYDSHREAILEKARGKRQLRVARLD